MCQMHKPKYTATTVAMANIAEIFVKVTEQGLHTRLRGELTRPLDCRLQTLYTDAVRLCHWNTSPVALFLPLNTVLTHTVFRLSILSIQQFMRSRVKQRSWITDMD